MFGLWRGGNAVRERDGEDLVEGGASMARSTRDPGIACPCRCDALSVSSVSEKPRRTIRRAAVHGLSPRAFLTSFFCPAAAVAHDVLAWG
ncbi:hypothetical protein GCM10023238_22700 [Streptomyces heliomycini]